MIHERSRASEVKNRIASVRLTLFYAYLLGWCVCTAHIAILKFSALSSSFVRSRCVQHPLAHAARSEVAALRAASPWKDARIEKVLVREAQVCYLSGEL